jgi:hypothetical protein
MPAELGPRPQLAEVSVVLEVLAPPRRKVLYYWALQVDLYDAEGKWGVGHTGLQWNPRYPRTTAVNWGGYAPADQGGLVLPGTRSPLPGFPDDPNTLSYSWRPNRPYRIRVYRSPETLGGWRAEVIDLVSSTCDVVRDLLPITGRQPSAGYLANPFVWSEVFADCGARSVTVRWSDLRAVDLAGAEVRPGAVRVNYQARELGGCPNTDIGVDEAGSVLQTTNTRRVAAQGSELPLWEPAGFE